MVGESGPDEAPDVAGGARRAKPGRAEQIDVSGFVFAESFDEAAEASTTRVKLEREALPDTGARLVQVIGLSVRHPEAGAEILEDVLAG
jgi:hypothetical protein